MTDRESSTRDLADAPQADASAAPEARRGGETEASGEQRARTESQPEQASEQSRDDMVEERPAYDDPTARAEKEQSPLLPDDQSAGFVKRWQEIQVRFVDEPRGSVAQADALVADLMQRLAAGFADERDQLEAQWDRGDDVSTEDLRVALTRYRAFFDRLLSA